MGKKALALITALILSLGGSLTVFAAVPDTWESTKEYLSDHNKDPLGLIASQQLGVEVNTDGISDLRIGVRSGRGEGFKSPQSLAMTVLALTACGYNIRSVDDVDLLYELANMQDIQVDSVSGEAWTLLAFDCVDYELDPSWTVTRENLVSLLLAAQRSDGGFASSQNGAQADTYTTALCLLALAPYAQDHQEQIQMAWDWLSGQQNADGAFLQLGEKNGSTTALAVAALDAYDLLGDSRFVKAEGDALQGLSTFYREGGGYADRLSGSAESTSTQLACIAIAASEKDAGAFDFAEYYLTYQEKSSVEVASQFIFYTIGIMALIFASLAIISLAGWLKQKKKKQARAARELENQPPDGTDADQSPEV